MLKEARQRDAELRFWRQVSGSGRGCWEWIGAKFRGGYGRFNYIGRSISAHRFAYEMAFGPIPDGFHIDHVCRNRGCVNPYHLDCVLPIVNWERGMAPSALIRQQTHCKNGHELTPDNTYMRSDGRRCRQCARSYARKSYKKHYKSRKLGAAGGQQEGTK